MIATIDRYIARQLLSTFAAIAAIVFALMLLEHLPRLFEIVRHSGSKGLIIWQTLVGLVPEYGSIAIIFGLYLAIAYTVRQFSMRGEIDALHAAGIRTLRWMRTPIAMAGVSAMLLFVLQGWLQPWGEARLQRIGEDMRAGLYGLSLEPHKFTDLGGGAALLFDSIDARSHTIRSVFLHTSDKAITAQSGLLRLTRDGAVTIVLRNGQCVCRGRDNRIQVLSFSRFAFRRPAVLVEQLRSGSTSERYRGRTLPQLAGMGDPAALAAALSRLLWPFFALAVPALALVLGQPPHRKNHAFGLLFGFPLLVLAIRLANFVELQGERYPLPAALVVGVVWYGLVLAILWAHTKFGSGFADTLVLKAFKSISRLWRDLELRRLAHQLVEHTMHKHRATALGHRLASAVSPDAGVGAQDPLPKFSSF